MKWDDILTDADFQAQPRDVKLRVAQGFFNDNIVTDADFRAQPMDVQDTVLSNFLDTVRTSPSQKPAVSHYTGINPPAAQPDNMGAGDFAKPAPSVQDLQKTKGTSTITTSDARMPVDAAPPVAAGDVARPFKAQAYEAGKGLNLGMESFTRRITDIGQYVGEKFGVPERSRLFDSIANTYKDNAAYWEERAKEVGPNVIDEIVGAAAGGALPGVAEFALGVPYAAVSGAAETQKQGASETMGAVKEGSKRLLLGQIFEAAGILKQPYAAVASSGAFAAQTAAEGGSPEDVAKSAGVGLLYGAASPGGEVGPVEIRDSIGHSAKAKVAEELNQEAFQQASGELKKKGKEVIKNGSTEEAGQQDANGRTENAGRQNAEGQKELLKSDVGIPTTGPSVGAVPEAAGIAENGVVPTSPEKASIESPFDAAAHEAATSPLNENPLSTEAQKEGDTKRPFNETKAPISETNTPVGETGYNKAQVQFIRDRLISSEGPVTIKNAEGGSERMGTGYPEWFQNKGYTKDRILNIADKAINGQKLTPTQKGILDELLTASQEEYDTIGKTEIDPALLQKGDKVIINGEEYEHKGFDKKTGEAVLKDGITIKIDPFETGPIKVDEVIPKGTDSGDFGPILRDYHHNAAAAIEKLKELNTGEAVSALYHPEVGDIDLVWGQEGNSKSNGYGLAKIVKYHPEVLEDLQGILSDMKVVERSENRINLESEKYRAAVRLEWDGKAKKWLLTAFEKRTGAGTTTDIPSVSGMDDTARHTTGSPESNLTPPAEAVKGKEGITTEHLAKKIDDVSTKLDEFLQNQTVQEPRKKATQEDMFGAKAGLEGKLPAAELKGDLPLEKAAEEARQNEAQKGQKDMFQGGSTSSHADTGGYAKEAYASKAKKAMELPEIVELAREINSGKYPRIRKALRAAAGRALGQFSPGKSDIALRADLAKEPGLMEKVLAHEIGHLVDYLPDSSMAKGNILGRIASLKKYMKGMLEQFPEGPAKPSPVLSKAERAAIREYAKKLAASEGGETKSRVTADDILNVWNSVDKAHPQLTAYIARLSASEKVLIAKEALKGKVPKIVSDNFSFAEAPQDIKAIYARLIKEEAELRGLFTKEAIMGELKDLTQKWKPFDVNADPKYTEYRHSPKELYADAFSVLINNPELLKDTAPQFYKAFFNYLREKPEVGTTYNAIQARLNDKAAIDAKRTENVREMYQKGEEAQLKAEQKKPLEIMKGIKEALVDKNTELIGKVKAAQKDGKVIAPEDNPVYWVEELPYVSGEVYNHLRTLDHEIKMPAEKAGISLDDLGEYMQFRRIATERAEIANPLGHTKETAQAQLDSLKARLGAEKYAKVQEFVQKYWELRNQNIIPLLEKADMYTPQLMEKIKSNENYAAFDVIAALEGRYGRNISGHIYKQIGTLHEIRNPFIATVMKDAALIRAADVNMTKQKTVNFLRDSFPGEVAAADTQWNGKYGEPVPPKNPEQGMITVLHKGKVAAFYVGKPIAETFQHDPFEANVILKVWQAINAPLRQVLVSRNPLWVAANIIRDFTGSIMHNAEVSAPKLIRFYARTFKDAYADVFKDQSTEVVSEMLQKKMLVVDRQFSATDISGETELDRVLQSFGKSEVRYRNMVVRPFVKLWDGLGKVGKFTERWGKVAGYELLKAEGNLSDKEMAHRVRSRVSTPDMYRRGAWNVVTNNLFMFSNIAKEGWRASIEAVKENPSDYAWKTVRYNIIPRLVFFGALSGLMGEAIKKVARGISDYDKQNYLNVPLGLTASGKSVYFRIPQDYTQQVIGGLVWNLMRGRVVGKGGAFGYGVAQSPYNVNPYITVASDVIDYMKGLNPYDSYRGTNVMPDRVFKAGGMRAHKEMGKYIWGQLGGGSIIKFQGDNVEKVQGTLEKALQYPPGNILGRFLKVSDTGAREDLRDITDKVARKEANRQLDVRDRVIEVVNKATDAGRKPTISEIVRLYRDLLKEGRIEPTMRVMQFRSMFNRYASKPENSAVIDAVVNAGGNAEKAALLRHYKTTMPEDAYKGIVRQLMLEGQLSTGALARERQAADEE